MLYKYSYMLLTMASLSRSLNSGPRTCDVRMLTSKIQVSHSALQSLPLKMAEGFKTKVVAPRNPKLVKQEDRARKVSK